MKPFGRRIVALFGLTGTMAYGLCVSAAGYADTIKKDTINSEIELSTAEVRAAETPLGDLVADAVRTAADSDAAFIAASSFSDGVKIPRGKITTADVLKSLEFKGDGIVVLNLKGRQITQALEHSLFLYPKSNSGYLQFSGLTVTVNPDGEKDKKVVSVRIGGAALDANRTYRVAMPAPLAEGALGYGRFWSKDDTDALSQKQVAGKTLESAVSDYLRDRKTLSGSDARLTKSK